VQLTKQRGRVDPEVAGQPPAEPVEHRQRVGPAPAAVQGHHEERLRSLAERLLRGQRLQVGHHLEVATLVEQALEALLDGADAQLGQAAGLDAGVVDLGQLVVGGPPPPAERFGEAVRRGLGVACPQRRGVVHDRLEAGRVDPFGPQVEPVPRGCRADRAVREQLPQPEHVGLEGRLVVGGQVVGPEEIGQLAGSGRRRTPQREGAQQAPLERTAGRAVAAVAHEPDGSQHADLRRRSHARPLPRPLLGGAVRPQRTRDQL
jgi:hypothetical protein